MTSGKLTVAYKTLACAQTSAGKPPSVAILDLTRSTTPDYLERCGLAVERVLIARPESARRPSTCCSTLCAVAAWPPSWWTAWWRSPPEGTGGMRYLAVQLGKLDRLLDGSGCLVLWIDEPDPAWRRLLNWDRGAVIRRHAALHLTFQQERWVQKAKGLAGYQAQARLLKSRWAQTGATAAIRITFNGTVRAQATW